MRYPLAVKIASFLMMITLGGCAGIWPAGGEAGIRTRFPHASTEVLAAIRQASRKTAVPHGYAADGLDRQHRGQPGPVLQGGEDANVRAGEDPPAHQAAVAVIEGVEGRAERGAEREGVGREPGLHLDVGLLPIALEREQVIPAPAQDPLGDLRCQTAPQIDPA